MRDSAAASVRRIDPGDEASLAAYVRIRNAVAPESTDSLDHIRWEISTYPGETSHYLAETADGTPVGTASTGRICCCLADRSRSHSARLGPEQKAEAMNRTAPTSPAS